jgi:hypothetical protein
MYHCHLSADDEAQSIAKLDCTEKASRAKQGFDQEDGITRVII